MRFSDFGYLCEIISDNGDLRPFLTLHNELKSRKISVDNLDEMITISRNIPITKRYNNELNDTLLNLENKIQTKKKVLSYLEYRKNNLHSEIRSLKASYIELKSKGLEKRLNLVQAIILDQRILLIAALIVVVNTFQKNQEFMALLNKTDKCDPSSGSRFMKQAEVELLEILLTSIVNHIVRSEFQNDKAISP